MSRSPAWLRRHRLRQATFRPIFRDLELRGCTMASPAMYPPRRRRSLAGPVVLIIIGIVFLLKNLGWSFPWWNLLADWWPVLLILIGAIKLWEYYEAKRAGEYASGVGGGLIVLMIFIIVFGLSMRGLKHVNNEINWGEVHDEL